MVRVWLLCYALCIVCTLCSWQLFLSAYIQVVVIAIQHEALCFLRWLKLLNVFFQTGWHKLRKPANWVWRILQLVGFLSAHVQVVAIAIQQEALLLLLLLHIAHRASAFHSSYQKLKTAIQMSRGDRESRGRDLTEDLKEHWGEH